MAVYTELRLVNISVFGVRSFKERLANMLFSVLIVKYRNLSIRNSNIYGWPKFTRVFFSQIYLSLRLSLELVPVVTDAYRSPSPETFHTAPSPSPPAMTDSGVGLNQRWDDSDDVSSTDDSCRPQFTSYRRRLFNNKVSFAVSYPSLLHELFILTIR